MRESSNVRKITEAAEPPVEKVIASAVNIVVGLAPDRQITFSTGFEGDEPDAVINARFDRIMRMADRLKGHYEIPDIEEDLAKSREALRNLRVDLERIDRQHDHDQAARRVQIAEMDRLCAEDIAEAVKMADGQILGAQKNKQAAHDRGMEDHRRSGKVGSYVPRGAAKADMAKCDEALASFVKLRDSESERLTAEYARRKAALEVEIEKATSERELHRTNQDINIERHEEGIAALEKKLARARALAGG